MNKSNLASMFAAALTGLALNAQAESIPVVILDKDNNNYSTSANNDPLREALTYQAGVADGHDIWTFDLSAFDQSGPVSISLWLQDTGWDPDNHNAYWDGTLLGQTGVATRGSWSFEASAGLHQMEVEWLNPIAGGAWYDLSITAVQPVPVPAAAWLFGSALVGLAGFKRKQRS